MKREEVMELVDRGIRELNEALAAGKSDRLQEFLAVMAKFPRYSFNNCLLIYIQSPSSSFVQGFHAWRKLGRTVVKGEKGIGIIAPMVGRKKERESGSDTDKKKTIFGFKVVHVFDVSQTEGDPLPQFADVTGDPGENITALESFVRSLDIELDYEPIPGGADGLSQKGRIVIAPDLEPAKRFLTLTHETSHELMHGDAERRKATNKTVRETEAEAVAHVVAQALGLQSIDHSADYIQLYEGDTEVFAQSMDGIQKTAAQILEGIQAHLIPQCDEAEVNV